jgi:hypothetical protein
MMANLSSRLTTRTWQLGGDKALLNAEGLQASVDISIPSLGLHELSLNGKPIAGQLLGVTVAEEGAPPTELAISGIDCFVRGGDLVANYPQCETQPFTLHNYWRIAEASDKLIVIDAIVSLQTTLLECYPKTILTTELPAEHSLVLSTDLVSPDKVAEQSASSIFESDELVGILLRGIHPEWSYVEITHPTDLGTWRIEKNGNTRMRRELGGEFQEKGVIRRLRVRGAFVSRENDEQIARQILAEFAASEPPLTA